MRLVQLLYSGLGGHSSVVFSLIGADKQKAYEHVLIFYGIEEMPASYIAKCNELGVRYYFVKKKAGLDMGSYKNIKSALNEVKPDIVLLHSINLILPIFRYVAATNIKLISVEHQPNHLKTKFEWLWSVMVMKVSNNVVYLTEQYAAQMKKRLKALYSSKKVSVINNGINVDLFKPSAFLLSENNSIGMLARLSVTKDHLTLVEAFKILLNKEERFKKLKLKIAGDGEMKVHLMQKVKELQIESSVEFLGMVPEHLNPAFLNALTIYVHASLGETMSTSLMQAMACGKAIIASDVEGINNMIREGTTGLLVPPKNALLLSDIIAQLLTDIELQESLGKNALEFAHNHFSNEMMFEGYRKLFV